MDVEVTMIFSGASGFGRFGLNIILLIIRLSDLYLVLLTVIVGAKFLEYLYLF
jgi:hypothetical protein